MRELEELYSQALAVDSNGPAPRIDAARWEHPGSQRRGSLEHRLRDPDNLYILGIREGSVILVENMSNPIDFAIRDQSGDKTYFRVRRATRFERVFDTYAQRKGVSVGSLRFHLDGERINPTQSPRELDMEDQDEIDCILEQQGD